MWFGNPDYLRPIYFGIPGVYNSNPEKVATRSVTKAAKARKARKKKSR